MRLIDSGLHLWSIWMAGFWGFVGAAIIILTGLFYAEPNWLTGGLLIVASVSIAIARYLKQPGTES